MHELPIAQSILEIALRQAKAENATRITAIRVVVGALTTYVDDSIRFYWDSIAEGTIAQQAAIQFIRKAGKIKCLSCSAVHESMDLDFRCPVCGGLWTHPLSGNDCFVESIDVETFEGVLACQS